MAEIEGEDISLTSKPLRGVKIYPSCVDISNIRVVYRVSVCTTKGAVKRRHSSVRKHVFSLMQRNMCLIQ